MRLLHVPGDACIRYRRYYANVAFTVIVSMFFILLSNCYHYLLGTLFYCSITFTIK